MRPVEAEHSLHSRQVARVRSLIIALSGLSGLSGQSLSQHARAVWAIFWELKGVRAMPSTSKPSMHAYIQ